MQLVPSQDNNSKATRRLIDSTCRELIRRQENLDFTLEDIAQAAKLPIGIVVESAKNSRGVASVTTIIERIFIAHGKEISDMIAIYLASSKSLEDIESGLVECVRQLCFLTRNDPLAKVLWRNVFENGHLHPLGQEHSLQRGQSFIDRLTELAPHWSPDRIKTMVTLIVQSMYQTARVVQKMPEERAQAMITEAEKLIVIKFRDPYCAESLKE